MPPTETGNAVRLAVGRCSKGAISGRSSSRGACEFLNQKEYIELDRTASPDKLLQA